MEENNTAEVADNTTIVDEPQALDESLFAGLADGALVDNKVVELPVVEKEEEQQNDEAKDDTKEAEQDTKEIEEATSTEDATKSDTKQAEQPIATAPAPPVIEEVEDPGEFVPSNTYSFSVVLTDGKTYNVKTLEDAEAIGSLLDENPELITASKFIEFNRKVTAMDTGLQREKTDWESKTAKYTEYKTVQDQRDATINQISNGFSYLENKGLLPKIAESMVDKIWIEHPSEPGIKERLALLDFMSKENESRIKAGLAPSFDVDLMFERMQTAQNKSKESEEKKRENEARKVRGSMVGGAGKTVSNTKLSNAIVGTGGSIDDIVFD